MENSTKTTLTVVTTINAPIEKVWACWTLPEHITQWNNATDDWHTPKAENDLRVGGSFMSRMEAKDGSFAFDFTGMYNAVTTNEYIAYTLGDGRKVNVSFTTNSGSVIVTENFEAEGINALEMQQAGWQAILTNFKKYTEATS